MLSLLATVLTVAILLWMLPRWPMALVGLYACIPFYKNVVDPLLLVDATVILALLSIAAFGLLVFRHQVLPNTDVMLLWLLILVVVVIGVSYSPNENALTIAVSFFALTFLPLLPLMYIGKSELHRRDFIASIFVVGLATFLTAAFAVFFGNVQHRLDISTSNTIGVSRAILLIPLILIATRHSRTGWRAYGAVALSLVSFLVAFATGSRGGLVAVIVAILFILFF